MRLSSRWMSGVVVALGLGLLAPIASAQPSADAARMLAELEVDLRAESIDRVLSSIAERLDRIDPTKAELVRGKRPSRTFAKKHLTNDAETMLRDLFSREISARKINVAGDLKFDLHLHRAYERSFSIRDISNRMPSAETGFEPPRSRGYPAEVAAIDNRAPHSMHDLHDYMADRFTTAALNRIVAEGRNVEIHVGGELEALSDLRNRGYKVIGEVKTPAGNYERIMLAEGPRGDVRYIITGDISGMDRVRHLSSLLRFAGPDGRGVPSNKVEIVGDVEALAERDYRSMRTGLERMGLPGDRAIIGFRGALKTELTERALARRGAEHLRDVLGAAPHEGLLRKLRAEHQRASGRNRTRLAALIDKVSADAKLATAMRLQPARVFSHVSALKKLTAAEKTLVTLAAAHPESKVLGELVADGKLRLPGGVSAKTYGVTRPIEFGPLRAEELRVRTRSGVESVKLLNNYYGDTMGTVVRALLDSGHSRLAYFGTAGGTGEGVRVGDVHVPERVYDFRGQPTSGGVRNSFLDYFEARNSPLGDRLNLRTELGNVFSPAEETMRWLENTRARGIHAVEVENSYITREVARHNRGRRADARASLHTAVVISDVPGSELTLGNNNGASTATFEKMVDHYLEAMGIKDLELVEKTEAKRPNRPLARDDRTRLALDVAEKLIPRERAKSSFLRDRLAGILGTLDVETLTEINGRNRGRLTPADIEGLGARERAALEADVNGAYTDADLLESLRRADGIVSRVAAELAEKHPRSRYELRVGGGIERGAYSPVDGLTLDVRGSAATRNSARAILERVLAETPNAPKVTLGEVNANGVRLGKGEVFSRSPRPLVTEMLDRAMSELGANHRGSRVEYSGGEHDAAADPSELFSRYETYAVGPEASGAELERFERLASRHGGRVEYVPSSDPRLRGGQGRTILDANGRPLVLLPSDRPVRKFALIDELTHLNQLDRMKTKLGEGAVRDLFERAAAGDPAAIARMLEWEIKAKRMIRMTLAEGDPNRALLDREVERLRRVLDPYLEVRQPNGRINWEKARRFARTHAEGSASFLLGLFLKDLARVVQTGDRAIIGQFFDGLATTEFWTHYGLFVVGAEAGTLAYTKFLQRFVKPTFVSSVLKSNVALATGMALPELIRGHFNGKAFAVNLVGLMLSSTAVKAGLAGIRWVVPLGRLANYRRLSRMLTLARGVPGWVYAGVETAVVLYFGESISSSINGWLEEREARKTVAEKAGALLAAARNADGTDDEALAAALEDAAVTYGAWRDRLMAGALEATARLNDELREAGRDAARTDIGVSRFESMASRYEHLRRHVDRAHERNDAEVGRKIDAAIARFERQRDAGLREAYTEGHRGSAYDPVDDAREVSENRPEAYDDEAALYDAAADAASDPEVAALLREWAATTREIKRRERELLDPTLPRASGGASGVLDALGD